MFTKIKSFLLENKTLRQTILKNAFWLTVSNVGGRLLRSIVIIYAARALGASAWGLFSYATSLVAFIGIFVDFGLNSIVTRETAKLTNPQEKARFISTAFYLKLILLGVGSFVILFIVPRFTNIIEARALLPLALFIMIFDIMREFLFSINRALERMEREAALYLFTNLAIVIFGVAVLLLSPNVTSFMYAYAIGTGIGMLATFLVMRKDIHYLFHGFTQSLVRPILSSAWPFVLIGILSSLLLTTDILLIGWFLSARDVGLYSASQRILQLIYILPAILTTSTFPAFARLAFKDDERVRLILERLIAAALAIAMPIALGGVLVGKALLLFLFGNEYGDGTLSFQLLILTLLIDFPATILTNVAFAYNHQKKTIIYTGIAGISNVILDLILIPRFGIGGSALATLIAQIGSNIYLWHMVKQFNNFTIWHHLPNIIAGTILMACASFGLQALGVHVILNIALSAGIYGAVLYVRREPLLREIKTTLQPLS